jgi:hypothetical protein
MICGRLLSLLTTGARELSADAARFEPRSAHERQSAHQYDGAMRIYAVFLLESTLSNGMFRALGEAPNRVFVRARIVAVLRIPSANL